MHHKTSHPLIRNTYNFETAHQRQAKESQRQPMPDRTLNFPHPHKFTQHIQQLQSKIEGVQNMVKAKAAGSDPQSIEREQAQRNKNIEKRLDSAKSKTLLGNSLSGQDFKQQETAVKASDYSPIRKSYRLPEPKKYTDESPIKIPPINLHAITSAPHTSPNNGASIASTTTSGSPPRKMSKKYDQSRSFMELCQPDFDSSFTLKLNNSFSTLLEEQRNNQINLFGNKKQEERGLKASKTLSYLNIKNTINQMKNRSSSKKPTKNNVIQGFELGRVLGKGKFGEVYLARHLETGFVVAMKKVEKRKLEEFRMGKQFLEQVRLHSSLDHPTIVKFYSLLEQRDSFYLVMEYIQGGTLFDFQNEVGVLSARQAADFLKDIIDALIYLHERSIAHRDIKPENIVVSSMGIAKLCDFGWSAVVQNVRSTFCGTLDYAPPEIIQRKTYDCTVDLWCIGVLAYELFVGKAPFEGQNRNEVMSRIVNIDKEGIPLMDELPHDAREFIEALLQKDPAKRPKIKQLFDFPLFSNLSPSKQKKERSSVK